jgi:ABC-type multidrug transport system ATPase subunit
LADVELEKENIELNRLSHPFAEFATLIEKEIQGKNRAVFKSTKLGGREIKIAVKRGLEIDLYNASSSIKQLVPLILYLRFRAIKNELLIIDEPEMNLHPESQSKLLEILASLVNAGLNVLITTHSPYFLSHLNNLVSGKRGTSALDLQAKSLYLKDSRAFLNLDDVSAYELVDGVLRDLKDEDYGIRWDTLSDVSAELQKKFFEIYEVGERTSENEERVENKTKE